MDPYLEGLTPEQCGRLGVMDTFAEGWEAGKESGKRFLKIMIITAVVGLIIGLVLIS